MLKADERHALGSWHLIRSLVDAID